MFDSVSPLEFRYLKNEETNRLRDYFSEEAFIRYLARVESALVKAYAEEGVFSETVAEEVAQSVDKVSATEVYEEEKRIHHQIRALVNCMKKHVSEESAPWIHLGATSHDIICTAEAFRYKEATYNLLLPQLAKLLENLITLAEREKATLQIGRTHGQHAIPLTFGFTIAEYIARLGQRMVKIKEAADNLCGQFSGAVGAYNAPSLLVNDPVAFERKFLQKINLEPAEHSTQIVPPEYQTDFFHAITSAFGVLANLADDMRHLQRSEINEIAEKMEKKQVGSSTMPHKRNPIHFEHVKSLWKTFMPRMSSLYLDQISEHQRDLTNSASSRFYTEIFCGFFLAVYRLTPVMRDLVVDKVSLEKNFQEAAKKIGAEPAYILLAKKGHPDAHELVRQCFHEEGKMEDLPLSPEEKEFLADPTLYIGKAVEKTEAVCQNWRQKLTQFVE